ncbi:MAG: hypothetical protein N2C14_26690 [Planctomycetales bacterium]
MNSAHSINPLFSLLRLVESQGGTNVYEIAVADGRRVAEIGVQEGRVCWITAPVKEVRLGEIIGRIVPRYATQEARGQFSIVAADARRRRRHFGEALLESGLVPYEVIRAAILKQIGDNARVMVDACGREPLACRRNELSVAYDPRLTFGHVEIILAIAAASDRLPRDYAQQIFEERRDTADAAMLMLDAHDPERLPLPIKIRGMGPLSLSQLLSVCKTAQGIFDLPMLNPAEAVVARLEKEKEGIWVGVKGSHRAAIFRLSKQEDLQHIIDNIPHDH